MKNRRSAARRRFGVFVCAVMLLFATVVTAEATPYTTMGAVVQPEDSWCLQQLEAYDPKYAAVYRLILETVQRDVTAGFPDLDDFDATGIRYASMDHLPYAYDYEELRDMLDDADGLLCIAIRRELRPVVSGVYPIVNYTRPQFAHGEFVLMIRYSTGSGWGAFRPYHKEEWEPLLASTNRIIAEAGITAENVDTLTDYEKALALHDVFLKHVYYSLKGNEWQNMYGGLVDGYCVCAGYAESYQWLLTQVGIPALYVTGIARSSHGWNIARLDGQWYEFDPTWDDIEYNGLPCRHTYFGLSSEDMSKDHTKDPSPLGYPDCPESLPDIDAQINPPSPTNPTVDNKVYTVLPTEQEGWSLSWICSARRGGTIYFTIQIDEDYLLGDAFAVTVTNGTLTETSSLHYEVTDFTEDLYVNVTGLVRKPSLSESGASISIGSDVCYGGSPVLASKVIPADAGELTWLWLVDGEPQIYYETVGELAIPRDWTGEEPYWIRLSGAGWVGKDVVLRVKAANYGGVLESSPARIGKCPTEITLPECFETKEGGTLSLSRGTLKERAGLKNVIRDCPWRMTLKDAEGAVCCVWSSDDLSLGSYSWKPEATGNYTLHVEYSETEKYLGAQRDVPAYVFPADQKVQTNDANFVFSFTPQGVNVSVSRHNLYADPKTYYAAFFAADGQFLGCGSMDTETYTAFTVPGTLTAARARLFALDGWFRPLAEARSMEF